ncbi:MAG TPA: hypothetical protein VGM06_10975 [Polyangiaceae bacterium]
MQQVAQKERASDFALTHSVLIVSIWTALEDAVRSLAYDWLCNDPNAWRKLDKVEINLGLYQSLSEEERAWYAIEQLEVVQKAPLKMGANRFEELLKPFGLSGPMPKELRDILFELSQVRHVLVHKRGRSDSRLLRNCPHLASRFPIGSRMSLTAEDFNRYQTAALEYGFILLERVDPESFKKVHPDLDRGTAGDVQSGPDVGAEQPDS